MENVRRCGRRLLDGHAGSAIKVLVAVHCSVLDARNGFISNIKGSMSKVAKSFICRGCLNPVTSAVCTSVDIGASAKLELVDKFCYIFDLIFIPTKARDYVFTGVGLSVCLFVCYHDN